MLSFLRKLRQKAFDRLFRHELEEFDIKETEVMVREAAFEHKKKKFEAEKEAFRKEKEAMDARDIVREAMKSLNPRLITSARVGPGADIIADIMEEAQDAGLSEEEFLADAKKLDENRAAPIIRNHIVRNLVVQAAQVAPTLAEINFMRASVNGVELYREEVERLRGLHDERTKAEPHYDKFEAL